MFCVLPIMLAAACAEPPVQQPAPRPAPQAATRIEGTGTEPFWSLTIANGMVRFERPDAAPIVERHGPVQQAHVSENYRTRSLSIAIGFNACSDGMSDRSYTRTVTLRINRQVYRGFADVVLPASQLAGRQFRILSVDAMQPGPGRTTNIAFTANRLTGLAGCNRFMGRWRDDRGRLVAAPLAMTRMACPGPGMAMERRFAEIMRNPVTVVVSGNRYILSGGEGGRIVLSATSN